MANIITKRISDFKPYLVDQGGNNEYLTGNELLVVAYNRNTYNIPLKYILGTVIRSIVQSETQPADDSYIRYDINLDDGSIQSFKVYNGSKGAKGETGDQGLKGLKGDAGKLLSDDDKITIVDNLETTDTESALSAAQGKKLGDALSDMLEVYLHSQEAYNILEADGNIFDNVKYNIYEEGDVTEEEIQYEIDNLYNVVNEQLKNYK